MVVALSLAGCAAEPARSQASNWTAAAIVPVGAVIGSDGHATILDAPPAPFTPAAAGQPQPLTPRQLEGHRQFARVGQFQNEVREQVQALADRLRQAEKGNFVDLYYDNEGEPSVVFRFLRDGESTLAKYSKHPRFRAETVRYSRAELNSAMDFMLRTFRDDRVIAGGGTGSRSNRAVVEINVPEEEFRALVARKGVTIPGAVELRFLTTTPSRAVNAPLPNGIARLVRIFPRDDRPIGMLNAIESRARVVLRDGCFRIADQDDALAMFPMGAQLFIDNDGYLAFGTQESPGYARVGETVVFPGSIAEETAAELVEPIRAACGAGKVIRINGMRSAAADRSQAAVIRNADALRQFREGYGLSAAGARAALEQCKRNAGGGVCLLSPPPPALGRPCPAGAKLSGGLCRTQQGHIRPVPKWLEPFMAL